MTRHCNLQYYNTPLYVFLSLQPHLGSVDMCIMGSIQKAIGSSEIMICEKNLPVQVLWQA